jgi:uncharacterized protein YbbC (DUF1343 family)/CubicO group peptidase (beta-lactamase class C family)
MQAPREISFILSVFPCALLLLACAPGCRRDKASFSAPDAGLVSPLAPVSDPGAMLNKALPPAPPSGAPSGAPSPEIKAAEGDEMLAQELDQILKAAIDRGEVPGAVALVQRGAQVLALVAAGRRSLLPAGEPMTTDTVFDLASLTKPLATSALVMTLIEQRKMRLRDPIGLHLRELAGSDKATLTVEQLLLHTAGLEADMPLVRGGLRAQIEALKELPLRADPGASFLYSDLGFLLLGAAAERAGGAPLDQLFATRVAAPLGRPSLRFRPDEAERARAAPTEMRGEKWLRGEVHDPRAAQLGGVAGHAGLFGSAADLGAFGLMLLRGGTGPAGEVLPPARVADWLRPRVLPGDRRRALGWDIQSGMQSPRGDLLSLDGVGHTGFTGTSIWVDRERQAVVVLLTSRLHREDSGTKTSLARLRREVADAAARRLDAARPVRTGLEVAARDGLPQLAGQRVALLTSGASRDRAGRRGVEVLREAGVPLVALFSPEHGLDGQQDHPLIGDARDRASGLPVFSLYGASRRPTAAQLAGLDAILVDLQDAGCRYYTYLSTLGYLLEEAAPRHIRVIVLDRPDPLGGEIIEGPSLDEGRTSFTGYHRVPVRHGMTLGELARLINAERALGADLAVIPAEGWRRSMLWDDTFLRWVDPSPNLRSPTAALLYPGVGMLEFTNLSVGRGTDAPFERLGAPWISGAALARAIEAAGVPGLVVRADSFVPTSGPHAGKACGGVHFTLTSPRAFTPVRLGIAIAVALRALYPEAWETERLDLLLGHRATAAAVLGGARSARDIAASWAAEEEAFRARRAPFLLY